MDDAEKPSVKRSRFDQTEPEPKKSRFDRRSRSPVNRRPVTSSRERSPLPHEDGDEARNSAKAAAAAIADKINSMTARKGIQHADVPPINNPASPAPPMPATTSNPSSGPPPAINGEMYVADGDYIQDIEVNDLRNRYILTKGSTQKMIQDETGADVTTRGSYVPNKSMATAANPPLYLHITSTSKAGLEQAVAKIKELIDQDLPQLVDDRRLRRRDQQEPVERDEFGRRKWRVETVPIDLEPLPGFNLRAQVVGHGGAYVKHIQQETGCRVQIKGRGSGYFESATGRESDEDMHLSVTGPDDRMIDKAKELCEDLISNVKDQYEEFKSRPPRQHGGHGGGHGGGYGGHGGHGGYGGHGGHGQNHGGYNNNNHRSSSHGDSYGNGSNYGRHSDSGVNSPGPNAPGASPATGTGSPSTAQQDYAAQYYQYYGAAAGGSDPYAAYGGYNNYVAAMYQYYQGQGQQAAPQAPGQAGSPPPPPPGDVAPPPPPPPPGSAPPPPPPPPGASSGSSAGGGQYSHQPPPPGL